MIAAARVALTALLTTDPQFVVDMQALNLDAKNVAVVPKVLKGNRRFDQVGQENYPCWMSDAGDMLAAAASNDVNSAFGMVINSTQQDWVGDIELALVWHQQDYDRSVDQTDAILPAVARLLLRNPDLQGSCTLAAVSKAISDRNFRHPTHVVNLTVQVASTVYRSA